MRKFLLAIVVGVFILMNAGCDGGPTTKLQPISNLRAYSKNLVEVGLTWTASPDTGLADEHHITITGGPVPLTVDVSIDSTNAIIGNLTEGVIYTFSVVVDAQTGYVESNPVTIKWSPARRITSDFTLPEIKVYETSSGSFPSGLVFFNASTNSSKTVSVTNPGADSLSIDVYLRTETNNAVSIRSAHLFRSTWRITRFSNIFRDASSLDDPQIQPPDTTTYSSTDTSVTVDSVTVTSSRIYYFKGNNGNYGRILVRQNPANNTLLWGSSPDQFLSLQISYQTFPYNPYSKPVGNPGKARR